MIGEIKYVNMSQKGPMNIGPEKLQYKVAEDKRSRAHYVARLVQSA
jgi:hypothetical protein